MIQTTILEAIMASDKDTVEAIIDEGIQDLNEEDERGRTPIFYAVQRLRVEDGENLESPRLLVFDSLLKSDAVHKLHKDNRGWTILSLAAASGVGWIVLSTLQQSPTSAVLEMRDNKDTAGRTPLSLAAGVGDDQGVAMLLNNEHIGAAEIDTKDKDGRTPLSWAAAGGHTRAARLLIFFGASAASRDNIGHSPCAWALDAVKSPPEGRPRDDFQATTIVLLTSLNLQLLDLKAKDGLPLLLSALEILDIPSLEALIPDILLTLIRENAVRVIRRACEKLPAIPRRHNSSASTALHWAAALGRENIVEVLLDAGAEVNAVDIGGRTPLHLASGMLVATTLIIGGADINAKDMGMQTPLMLAMDRKDGDVLDTLLQQGVDLSGITVEHWRGSSDEAAEYPVLKLMESDRSLLTTPPGALQMSFESPLQRDLFDTGKTLYIWLRSEIEGEEAPSMLRWAPSGNQRQGIRTYMEGEPNSFVSVGMSAYVPDLNASGTRSQRDDMFQTRRIMIGWSMPAPVEIMGIINFFSSLPNGWMPVDDFEFFNQFIQYIRLQWTAYCDTVQQDLSQRRDNQLAKAGNDQSFVKTLARDARRIAVAKAMVAVQVRTGREFLTTYCARFNKGPRNCPEIELFREAVNDRLSRLDQEIRDLLQFEFAWVSVIESHRSTSLGKSMKRLSWITFIFLPAIFASSLFGMNVNILADNPDWRWYLLCSSLLFVLTFLGWLLFKFAPIEEWLENEVDARLQRRADRKKAKEPIKKEEEGEEKRSDESERWRESSSSV